MLTQEQVFKILVKHKTWQIMPLYPPLSCVVRDATIWAVQNTWWYYNHQELVEEHKQFRHKYVAQGRP